MAEVVYESTVTAVGELVSDFRDQGLLVWFGEGALPIPSVFLSLAI